MTCELFDGSCEDCEEMCPVDQEDIRREYEKIKHAVEVAQKEVIRLEADLKTFMDRLKGEGLLWVLDD